jgi:DNA-binding transcriptional MerR regulator
MAKENEGSAAAGAAAGAPLTLTAVSNRTGISMPTLQKYKKRYGHRIPSVGKGRKQRYPEAALPVFEQLRDENMARRGRPRKDASAAARGGAKRRGRPARGKRARTQRAARSARPARRGRPRKAVAKAKTRTPRGEGLLTLTQVAQRTKISYPTLLRYVKAALDKIPHVGSGRRRRFKPAAVAVFQKLRGESRRGRPPGKAGKARKAAARRGRPPGAARAAGAAAVSKLNAAVAALTKRLASVEKELRKPLKVVRK